MAHPYQEHRATKVEHRRVAHIAKGHKSGGAVEHGDEAADKSLVRRMVKKTAMRMDGGRVNGRADKPNRARGGRTKGHGKTNVNVIVGHPGPAGAMAGPGLVPPPMAPRLPPGAPPGMGPAGSLPPGGPAGLPPGAGAPGLPPGLRRAGGRVRRAK